METTIAGILSLSVVEPAACIAAQPQERPNLVESRRDAANVDAVQNAPQLTPSTDRSQQALEVGTTAAGFDREFGEQQIVQRRAQVEPWSATADTQLFYTNNVALTPSGEQQDWYLRTGATVAYTNRVKGPLFVDFSLSHHLFRYGDFDVLDFDLTRFDGGVVVQVPQLSDAFLFGRYSFQRIGEPNGGSPVYQGHSAVLGGQKVWKISRGQQIFAGLSADIALNVDPASSARDEYGLTFGYNLRLTEQVTARASYRGAWYHYREGDRNDFNQILSLGLDFAAADWLRISASGSFSLNESSAAFADYQNVIAGAGISLGLTF